jgi:alpha-mannosidase
LLDQVKKQMENLNEMVFLLPEYELEGYPRDLPGEKAARVLSGWVGMWHPSLICGAGRIPRWHPASRLPTQRSSVLFVLPPISVEALEEQAEAKIREAGGEIAEPAADWRSFQAQLLDLFPQLPRSGLADELSEEFAALGYAYLQIQLMTRKLRYTSNMDVSLFEEQVIRATEAVLQGDSAQAVELLQACFDTLGQERDHYYSNDAYLIDLTLLAQSTLGSSLERQLADPHPTTLLASAELLKLVGQRSASSLQSIRSRLAEKSLGLAGGMDVEGPTSLAPRESAVRALLRAPLAYRQLEIDPPRVFGRLSFGLQADSAALLKRLGFKGALLIALTGGVYPCGSQPKISWESHDGSRLPALATIPLDANDPNTYLDLGWTVGEALDRQHVPTLVLAHWPGADNDFYRLLKVIAARTPVLGKWCLAEEYFDTTEDPYHHQRLESDAFVFDWLGQSSNPGALILTTKQTHKLQARARSLQNMANLIWQLRNVRENPSWSASDSGDQIPPSYQAPALSQWYPDLEPFFSEIDQLLHSLGSISQGSNSLGSNSQSENLKAIADQVGQMRESAAALSKDCMEALSSLLIGKGGDRSGRLIFNPRSSPIRCGVKSAPDEGFDQSQSWHYATGLVGSHRMTCVDIPAMGFVATTQQPPSQEKLEAILLADSAGLLRSEFVEAQVDMKRGHLRSLHIPAVRGNRFSAMLAYRCKLNGKIEYSEMVAKDVSMLTCSNMFGLVRARGHMSLQGKSVGNFVIDYEIQRGSRMVVARISLTDLKYPHPSKNLWQNCFVLRWAWPTEAAILRVFPDGRRTTWSGGKAVSAELVEIDEVDYRTHVLTGGLAFHRRQDLRFAETILTVDGQSSAGHRVAFAVDLPHPLATARSFIDKTYEVASNTLKESTTGWLLSVDTPNILVDLESPLLDDQGRTVGLRMTVSELAGQSTTAKVRLFRDVGEAHRVDYLGERLTRLTSSGDQVSIAMRANEQALVDLLWKPKP